MIIIDHKRGIFITPKMKKGKIKYPKFIPVHLAHNGNCLPFQKNDLSGFWWQNVKCKFAPLIFKSFTFFICYLFPKAKIIVTTNPIIIPKIETPQA